MARGSRVVLNRSKLNELQRKLGGGARSVAIAIHEASTPHDAPPYGQGLVEDRGWGVWVDGKKVDGDAQKPREARLGKGIVALVGWGFPGRFHHNGTVDTAANPQLAEGMAKVVPSIPALFREGTAL